MATWWFPTGSGRRGQFRAGSSVGGTTVSNTARLELRNNVAVANERLTLNGSGGGLGALDNVSDTNSWSRPDYAGILRHDRVRFGAALAGNSVAAAGFALTFNTTGDITVNGSHYRHGDRLNQGRRRPVDVGGRRSAHLQRDHFGQPGNAGLKRPRRRFPTARSLMSPPARRSMSRRSWAGLSWAPRASKLSKAAGR